MTAHGRATRLVAEAMRSALERHRAALGGGPLLLAVSGGADSLAMLLATASLPRRRRPLLIAAHFSHGLRPEAEPEEAALVIRVAAACDIPLVHEHGTVRPSEAAAREARYRFLARSARTHDAGAVATAHTQDDQAETLLLRLTRGAGTRGAGAIREISSRQVDGAPLVLLRPLLAVGRAETEAVCREAGIVPAADLTNQSPRYARNRVRLRVLPELGRINPGVRRALAQHAAAAQDDEDLLDRLAEEAVLDAETISRGAIQWPRTLLTGLPGPLLVRVLQRAWGKLAGEGSALSTAKLRAVRELLASGGGGEVDLGEGLQLTVEQDTCRLEPVGAEETVGMAEEPLRVPGTTRAGCWLFDVWLTQKGGGALSAGAWQAALDAGRTGTRLWARGRSKGDRFHPLGMEGLVKLQDFLVNARVPRTERDAWPLVVVPEGIVWVPGVRIAEWAKVTGETKSILWLSARRAD